MFVRNPFEALMNLDEATRREGESKLPSPECFRRANRAGLGPPAPDIRCGFLALIHHGSHKLFRLQPMRPHIDVAFHRRDQADAGPNRTPQSNGQATHRHTAGRDIFQL